MRFTQAFIPSRSYRFYCGMPLLAGAIGVALLLSGCASRSLLGEPSPTLNQPSSAATASGAAQTSVTPASGAQTTSVTYWQRFLWVFSPYHPTIQQGNFISEEMFAQLKVDMTREQVRFILGTPLLTDIFHADRWDYPFRLAKGNGEITTSRVVVFFKDGKVERFEGGNLPTEKVYIARIVESTPIAPYHELDAEQKKMKPPQP